MTNTPPKALTYDEKKAAEAAFAGLPFNEAWSASARAVYDGIVKALPHTDIAIPSPSNIEEPTEALSAQREPLQAQEPLALEPQVDKNYWRGLRCLRPFATGKRRFRPGS